MLKLFLLSKNILFWRLFCSCDIWSKYLEYLNYFLSQNYSQILVWTTALLKNINFVNVNIFRETRFENFCFF